MRKINLLYVITKLELGGAQKQLLSLISRLDKESYNPALITADEGLLVKSALSIEDLKLERLGFLERPISPFKDPLALYQIYRFIKKNKIDIVHTHSSKAGIIGRWAARLARVKIIVHTVHGWSFNKHQNFFLRKIFIWLERLTARITDKLIVVSSHDQQRGLDNHIGNNSKYQLIRYGINYQAFSQRKEGLREELGINNSDLLVGMVSCFKPQKSPQDFIRLAYLVNKSTSRVKFLLVGDGVLRRKVERLITEFNLEKQVILTGWRRDISRILSAVDIFVLTSLWEGLPISVLEAMAASLPVVATNTGGIAEVVLESQTGFLVPPGQIQELAGKIGSLLKDEALRTRVGKAARRFLGSNFTIENMVRSTDNLYQDLIKAQNIYVG